MVSQERKLREYIQEDGCLPTSLFFRADCFEGQQWKPRDAIFQSSEKALKEPVSPKPQWSLFTGICPFSSINGYAWLDVFSALENRYNVFWEKKGNKKSKAVFTECFTCGSHTHTPTEGNFPSLCIWPPHFSPRTILLMSLLFSVTLHVTWIIRSPANGINNGQKILINSWHCL